MPSWGSSQEGLLFLCRDSQLYPLEERPTKQPAVLRQDRVSEEHGDQREALMEGGCHTCLPDVPLPPQLSQSGCRDLPARGCVCTLRPPVPVFTVSTVDLPGAEHSEGRQAKQARDRLLIASGIIFFPPPLQKKKKQTKNTIGQVAVSSMLESIT